MRVLFILKLGDYGYSGIISSGLFNSAQFIVDMLNANGQTAKLVQVPDNNSIDKEVTVFKPDVVIIEALWVVPTKFAVLTKLHPTVKWVVRVHSDLPFLSHEGMAMEWLFEYLKHANVSIAFNDQRIANDFAYLISDPSMPLYLPNYYPISPAVFATLMNPVVVIGCFGAIRPLKNQLLQAMAAILYAKKTGRPVEFHINSTRIEGGEAILKNMRALFAATDNVLIEHPWLPRADFLELISTMSIVMAVSLSETFCITAADAVSRGVPLICSEQVPWADSSSIVDATSVPDIIEKLDDPFDISTKKNQKNLRKYSEKAQQIWLRYLG
jgi:hypothetical protein